MLAGDVSELLSFLCVFLTRSLTLTLTRTRSTHHVLIITCVTHILVFGYDVHVLQSDVDPDRPGLAVPEEVRQLFVVRHVVGRVHVPRALEVLQEDILRRFYPQFCRNAIKIVWFMIVARVQQE